MAALGSCGRVVSALLRGEAALPSGGNSCDQRAISEQIAPQAAIDADRLSKRPL